MDAVDHQQECAKGGMVYPKKNLNKGDFLIDDRIANGAGDVKGELIRFGSEKFPNWDSVINYFENLKPN